MKKLALFLGMSAALVAHETKGQDNFVEKAMLLGAPDETRVCLSFLDNKKSSLILSMDYKIDKTQKKVPVKLAIYQPNQETPDLETDNFDPIEETNSLIKSMYWPDENKDKDKSNRKTKNKEDALKFTMVGCPNFN